MSGDVQATSCPLYLPRCISSSHNCCVFNKVNNNKKNENQEDYLLGMAHFQNEEHAKAREIFETCIDNSVEAKYQLAVMYYDGLGGSQECVS